MGTEKISTRILTSHLMNENRELGDKINSLWKKAQSLRADKGSDRLETICENIYTLPLEGIRNWIDAVSFQQEIEEAAAKQKKMNTMQLLYDITRLFLPVVMIVPVLLAIEAFALDTAPADRVKSFIQLWQEGFHGVMFVVPLSVLVIVVSIILLAYITLSLMLNAGNRAIYKQSTDFAEDLQAITQQLIAFKRQNDSQKSSMDEQKATEQLVIAIKVAFQEVSAHQKSLADTASIETIQRTIQPVINALDSRLTEMTKQLSVAISQAVERTSVGALEAVVENSKAGITTLVENISTLERPLIEAVEAAKTAVVGSNNRTIGLYNKFTPLVDQLKSDMGVLCIELRRYQGRLDTLTEASKNAADAASGLTTNARSYESTGRLLNDNIAKLTLTQGDVAEKIQAIIDRIGGLEGKIEASSSALTTTATSLKEFADALRSSVGEMDKRVEAVMSGVLIKVEEAMQKFVSSTEESMKLTEEAMQRFVSGTEESMKLTSQHIEGATSSLSGVGPELQSTAETLRQVVHEFSKLENTVEALQQIAKELSKGGRRGIL